MQPIDDLVRGLTANLASQRASESERVARSRLPRCLRWTTSHLRLLKLIYRVHPSWRPMFVSERIDTSLEADGDMVTLTATETFRWSLS